jgi:hypothetical protein
VKAPEEVKAAAEVRREAKQSNFIMYCYVDSELTTV